MYERFCINTIIACKINIYHILGIHIINTLLLPLRAYSLHKTPYEILTGNKPNISYFWVFGCKCFYIIKGVCLCKFESKALEGILLAMVSNLTLIESMISSPEPPYNLVV